MEGTTSCRGRPGRPGAAASTAATRRQQLHDRRRQQQRLRPPHRQLAQLRQIEEMRVETSNFDASQGHGTGLTISMMTRAGTNTLRGSGNYTHWNNQINSPNLQQKVTFKAGPAPGGRVSQGPRAHRRLHARRPARHSEGRQRARQGVLLRQLLDVERLGARPPCRHLDRAGQPQAARRRFLRSAAVAVGCWRRHAEPAKRSACA